MSDDPFVIDTPVRKRLTLLAAGVAMTAASAWLALLGPYGVFGAVVGGIGLAFFGTALGYMVIRTAIGQPVLRVDSTGFTDQASALAVGFVSWRDVAAVTVQSAMGQPFVAVKLRDPDAYLRRQPGWKRVLLRINRRFWAADVYIPGTVLPMSPGHLAEMMDARRRQSGG